MILFDGGVILAKELLVDITKQQRSLARVLGAEKRLRTSK
jgi:hypothetical protein